VVFWTVDSGLWTTEGGPWPGGTICGILAMTQVYHELIPM